MDAAAECDSCRKLLSDEDNPRLADLVEARHAKCGCQNYAVGRGSPGPVANAERLHRVISSPRDVNPETGLLLETPFSKVYGNGLSVCRSLATDTDIVALAIEALAHEHGTSPRQLIQICEVSAEEVRNMKSDGGDSLFCVYDQTVSRHEPTEAPIPTHAGIFQRLPLPGTADRKKLQRDFAGKLRERFIAGKVNLSGFRAGVLHPLNHRAMQREFEKKGSDPAQAKPAS